MKIWSKEDEESPARGDCHISSVLRVYICDVTASKVFLLCTGVNMASGRSRQLRAVEKRKESFTSYCRIAIRRPWSGAVGLLATVRIAVKHENLGFSRLKAWALRLSCALFGRGCLNLGFPAVVCLFSRPEILKQWTLRKVRYIEPACEVKFSTAFLSLSYFFNCWVKTALNWWF